MHHAVPRLGDFLCFAIYSAGHAFHRVYKPMLEALGLTYPQYLVMAVLWAEDGQTVSQIGERLFLESSTLTPLLKRLERAGHLRRMRGETDQRIVHAWLTASGQDLRRAAESLPGSILAATGGSVDHIQRLKRDIDALRDALLRSSDAYATATPADPRRTSSPSSDQSG